MAAILDERQRFSTLLCELRQQATEFRKYVDNLATEFRNEEFEKDKGISLLQLKCQMMLNYLTNLSYLSLRKLSRMSIVGDEGIFRLAETRTVLERIRPIEQKLQYQIDKLLKSTVSGNATVGDKDALSFKPNPNALVANKEQDEESMDDEEPDDAGVDQKQRSKVYVPPKLMAMPYDEESSTTNRAVEKSRRRAFGSSLVRELQEQYGHGPEELLDTDRGSKRHAESQKERLRYEEDNFVRLQMSKAQKRAAKRVSAKSTLQSLLDFGEYHMDDGDGPRKRKRSRTKSKTHSKGKGKGRRK